jgi:hypothetical protein
MPGFSTGDIGCVVLRQGWLLYRFARGDHVERRKLATAAIALDLVNVEGRACSSKVSIYMRSARQQSGIQVDRSVMLNYG